MNAHALSKRALKPLGHLSGCRPSLEAGPSSRGRRAAYSMKKGFGA